MRGIRGATTAAANTPGEITGVTVELLRAIVAANHLRSDEIVAAFFTATSDLDAAFPATAARRELGWDDVALMDLHQMAVPTDLARCIRVLLLVDRATRSQVTPVYLRDAKRLRPDLADIAGALLGESTVEADRR